MEPTKTIEARSLEDMASEHEERIERIAEEAAARIAKGQHWLDWLAIGEGLVVGRLRSMRRSGMNRPEGSAYNRAFGDWMDAHKWARDLDKATRNHAMWCADHRAEIEYWRETLAANVRANLNHPTSIKRRYEAAHKVDKDESENVETESRAKQLERRCAELEDEVMTLKSNRESGYVDPTRTKAKEMARIVFESGAKWVWLTDFRVEVERLHEAARAKQKERNGRKTS